MKSIVHLLCPRDPIRLWDTHMTRDTAPLLTRFYILKGYIHACPAPCLLRGLIPATVSDGTLFSNFSASLCRIHLGGVSLSEDEARIEVQHSRGALMGW